jgi:hypothetical protein
MGMTTTTKTVTELRNSYKALMAACLKNSADSAETFNRKVTGLMHELADGEAYEMTPSFYLRAAQEVAYNEYNVNFRNVTGA